MQSVAVGQKTVNLIYIASAPIKDILANLRGGKGASWEIYRDIDAGKDKVNSYHHQMNGETKREVIDRKGGSTWEWHKAHDNHAWDCETYQVGAALMMSILAGSEIVE
jgi:hypothetical protein